MLVKVSLKTVQITHIRTGVTEPSVEMLDKNSGSKLHFELFRC